MKKLSIFLCVMGLSSCQFIPEIAKDFESIATDTAIKIEISREAMSEKTNLQLNLDVKNKEFEVK